MQPYSDPPTPPVDPNALSVELSVLSSNAPGYAYISGDIIAQANTTAKQLAALGRFWGNDNYGDMFEPDYTKVSSGIFEAMTTLAEDMSAICFALEDAARRYGIADDAGSDRTTPYPQHGGGAPA